MEYFETIIVGGGPAGASCAWKLRQAGREVLILDRASFPRLKLCAGWIPADVFRDLEISPDQYPHSLLRLATRLHIAPLPFALMPWPTRGVDLSIRRIEFDDWMLKRAAAPFRVHRVNRITQENGTYILDGKYACKVLIGAGGNGCPVRRQLFPGERNPRHQILALEQEFHYPRRDPIARFFFFFRGLMGYAWYVPKGNGFLNIGLGGFADSFGSSRPSIHEHFDWFLQDLYRRNLLAAPTGRSLRPSGYAYSMASDRTPLRQGNCLLIGDSAAMATIDFAEGIGPAIRSGLLAARELLGEADYTREALSPFSIRAGLRWMRPALLALLAPTSAAS